MTADNRTVLLTGASGHLGQVICNKLSELKYNIIITDTDSTSLQNLRDNIITEHDISIQAKSCNLASYDDRCKLGKFISSKCDQLYCIINAAAFVGEINL